MHDSKRATESFGMSPEDRERLQELLGQCGTAQLQEICRRLAPQLEQICEELKNFPARTREALRKLAERGWYLDLHWSSSLLGDLEERLDGGDVVAVDDDLCDYFDGQVNDIEALADSQFRDRAGLIRAATGAHRRGDYALSVPVLLAQVDGICKEKTGGCFFTKQVKLPGVLSYLDATDDDDLKSALLGPLVSVTPINMSERDRPEGFDGLNRHQVLHGERLDYDTRANSAKALSLLYYVMQVLLPPK